MHLVNLAQRYAPLVPPEGLVLLGAREGEGWTLEPYPLPEGQTLVVRAEAALLHALREAGEGGLPRKALLEDVVAQVDVSERTAKSALANLKARGAVTEVALGGRGNPKAYRLTASKDLFAQNNQNETSALRNAAYFGKTHCPERQAKSTQGKTARWSPRRARRIASGSWSCERLDCPPGPPPGTGRQDEARSASQGPGRGGRPDGVRGPGRLGGSCGGRRPRRKGGSRGPLALLGRMFHLKGWLREWLALLGERFPEAREVELLGVWAGNPPRLEVIARVRPRSPSP